MGQVGSSSLRTLIPMLVSAAGTRLDGGLRQVAAEGTSMARPGDGIRPRKKTIKVIENGKVYWRTKTVHQARAFDEKVESLIVDSHDGANRIQDPHWCKGGQS